MAHEVHQVGRVLAIEDREGRVEADAVGVLAQQPRADAVEGPGPRQHRVRHARPLLAQHRPTMRFDAPGHLRRGAAGEGQQQDAARIGALDHEVGDAVRQRVGLARAGAGDDQQRAAVGAVEPVPRRGALLGVEAREEAVDAGGGRVGEGKRGERGSGHGGDRSGDCESIQYTHIVVARQARVDLPGVAAPNVGNFTHGQNQSPNRSRFDGALSSVA